MGIFKMFREGFILYKKVAFSTFDKDIERRER